MQPHTWSGAFVIGLASTRTVHSSGVRIQGQVKAEVLAEGISAQETEGA